MSLYVHGALLSPTLSDGESSESLRFFRIDLVGRLNISSSSFLRRAICSSLNPFLVFSVLSSPLWLLELELLLTLRLLGRLLLRPRLAALL